MELPKQSFSHNISLAYPRLETFLETIFFLEFPETVTTKQKYRLLGNSLNVLVVAELMKILFTSENK